MKRDSSDAIKAIRNLYADPEMVGEVLAALASQYAGYLRTQGHDTLGNEALRHLDEAQDALGELSDWERASQRAA